jgi:uncharacterized protein YcfJ
MLGGCTADYAPYGDLPVPAEVLDADFESCRSSAAATRAAAGAEGLLAGALLGAAHGAVAGAHHGGADLGAIIGADVGAVAGFAHRLSWSRGASESACMHAKGCRRV